SLRVGGCRDRREGGGRTYQGRLEGDGYIGHAITQRIGHLYLQGLREMRINLRRLWRCPGNCFNGNRRARSVGESEGSCSAAGRGYRNCITARGGVCGGCHTRHARTVGNGRYCREACRSAGGRNEENYRCASYGIAGGVF